ncbi:MAG: serine/threonine protein kinase [Desulfobacterales bacterium]|nr:serine/threonine protein kinase [Desulfobacterales bacterium]
MSEFKRMEIGEYQIVELIDASGRWLVYKAFQPSMNRYVAIKVLNPKVTRDPTAKKRFFKTGEWAARMQYPYIMPVYETDQEGDTVYRVTPYVEGGTLRERIGEFYDSHQALDMSLRLSEALVYLHGHGCIHGNLKSSNILLDDQKRPLLTEFGSPEPGGGTPNPYRAPELVQDGVINVLTDVYALGVLLYEMLIGEAPQMGVAPSPRAMRPEMPKEAEEVILKAMARNPKLRFQTPVVFRHTIITKARHLLLPE